jgi:hypothetical protein
LSDRIANDLPRVLAVGKLQSATRYWRRHHPRRLEMMDKPAIHAGDGNLHPLFDHAVRTGD